MHTHSKGSSQDKCIGTNDRICTQSTTFSPHNIIYVQRMLSFYGLMDMNLFISNVKFYFECLSNAAL